ncbi:MAG: hypothetical protein BMS9Abin26_1452 [Gammaproteobacteria bacterium]|nr:MAG: hypothetical protein BMS9Abin26_1452 [Gammaproteobacteria bacterium]
MSTFSDNNRGIRIGRLLFRPRLIPTIVTLILLPVLLRLGFWQLQRAEEKVHVLETYEQRRQSPELDINDLADINDPGDVADMQHYPVKATGIYAVKQHLLLDNRVHNGRVGYQVITPLLLAGKERALLVNRGWIPMGNNREDLPDVPTGTAELLLHGVARLPSIPVFEVSREAAYEPGWPKVVQYINTGELAGILGYPVMPFMLLLNPGEADGFVRDWKLLPMPPEKHISYAWQWFGLSAGLLIIFFVVNIRRMKPVPAGIAGEDRE